MLLPWLVAPHSRAIDALRLPLAIPGFEPAEVGNDIPQPSPDGNRVLWSVFDTTRQRQLAVSSLRPAGSQSCPEQTVSALLLVTGWSGVAFFRAGKLQKIAIAGGNPQTIMQLPAMASGSWSSSGEILYTPNPRGPLYVVSENGGAPSQITSLKRGTVQNSHRDPISPRLAPASVYGPISQSQFNCVYLADRTTRQMTRLEGSDSTHNLCR